MKERYLAFTDLVRVADVKPNTDVEVVIQSKGGRGRPTYKSRVLAVNETRQPGNEQVILVSNSGRKQFVGGGTSVRRI